ncbi:hypothetical protein [Psychroserpens luteus]|uniref:Uncharacterized protein n=1 Tax=Psychroserpens luteus TaxID=1434066 RepID=A0ABW6A085_9FLAO|nr:hypothetical protein [Psychroserpens luteus]
MVDFLLKNGLLVIDTVEIMAAIFGSYYISKVSNSVLKIFVYYLWLTVFIEITGAYSFLLLNNYDLEWYINLKNSVFCSNTWLYNIYSFLAIGIIGLFYSNLMTSKVFKNGIRVIFIAYAVFAFAFFTFTDAFFTKSLPYSFIFGTVSISIYVIFYFIELMRSDEILSYYKLPSFYISIALLIWYICVTPLFIFDSYFYEMNTKFVEFRGKFLLFINIFTYLCFAFGFWYSLKKSKQ